MLNDKGVKMSFAFHSDPCGWNDYYGRASLQWIQRSVSKYRISNCDGSSQSVFSLRVWRPRSWCGGNCSLDVRRYSCCGCLSSSEQPFPVGGIVVRSKSQIFLINAIQMRIIVSCAVRLIILNFLGWVPGYLLQWDECLTVHCIWWMLVGESTIFQNVRQLLDEGDTSRNSVLATRNGS